MSEDLEREFAVFRNQTIEAMAALRGEIAALRAEVASDAALVARVADVVADQGERVEKSERMIRMLDQDVLENQTDLTKTTDALVQEIAKAHVAKGGTGPKTVGKEVVRDKNNRITRVVERHTVEQ